MRTALAGILALLVFGSCREIRVAESTDVIDGYELRGTVTSQNGIPLDSVAVTLYYDLSYVGPQVLDTVPVIVADSTKILYVAVFGPSGRYVRQLFFGFRTPGPVPRFRWDGRDDTGFPVSCGEYFVRYIVDTTIVKDVPVLTDGNVTATTDENGEFVLTGERFPIGRVFGLYSAADEYAGAYRVMNAIQLQFLKGSFYSTYVITMNTNTITRSTFTLQ